MTVAARLEAVAAEVAGACRSAGRAADAVRLVAVSKNATAEQVFEAVAAGQRTFGENYVRDGIAKMRAVADLCAGLAPAPSANIEWHMIGQLQSNKAARAARAFDVVESLSTDSAARAISRAMAETSGVRSVLMQVHLGGPTGRGGVAPAAALELARAICDLPGLRLDGVMGVAPQHDSPRVAFSRLAGVLEELRAAELSNAPLGEMSAGMSGDFADAIAAGATIVRIGSAIFGR